MSEIGKRLAEEREACVWGILLIYGRIFGLYWNGIYTLYCRQGEHNKNNVSTATDWHIRFPHFPSNRSHPPTSLGAYYYYTAVYSELPTYESSVGHFLRHTEGIGCTVLLILRGTIINTWYDIPGIYIRHRQKKYTRHIYVFLPTVFGPI